VSPDRTYTYKRPIGVTILVVLLWIQAVILIFAGLALIFEHNDHDLLDHVSQTSNELLAYGIGSTVVGAITGLVAFALGGGSNFARWIAGLVAFIDLLGGIYSLITLDGATRGSAIVTIIVAFVVLYILFGERGSREFFTGR
jgi:uncharacterized membrane protein (DUF2068 family)